MVLGTHVQEARLGQGPVAARVHSQDVLPLPTS